jgi:hypothetical protein
VRRLIAATQCPVSLHSAPCNTSLTKSTRDFACSFSITRLR